MTVEIEQFLSDETAQRVADWVRPDEGRMRLGVYSDPDIFAAEIERIWKSTWLWAGHESEVPNPGDFVSRTVGTVPIIICRTADGSIAISVNVCAHRGNKLCFLERGTTEIFKCPYHGWAYRNTGELAGIPFPKAYEEGSDVWKLRLPTPAKVANYRGLIWVSYSEDVPSIEEHLGTIRPELDRIFELSPSGKIRLDVGSNSLMMDCNWKTYQENGSDNYHGTFTHASGFVNEETRRAAQAISSDESLAVVRLHDNGHTQLDFRDQERAMGIVIRSGSAGGLNVDDERRHFDDLVAAVGEERAKRAFEDSPVNLYIYPNLFIIQQDLRRVEPISPDRSVLVQHPYMFDGVPDSVNFQRVARHEAAYGPAGFIITDDMEVWARIQEIANAVPDQWTNHTRGIHRERVADNGEVVGHVTDETGARGAWKQYLRLMTQQPPRQPTFPEDRV